MKCPSYIVDKMLIPQVPEQIQIFLRVADFIRVKASQGHQTIRTCESPTLANFIFIKVWGMFF